MLSHMLFADDTLIFLRGHKRSMTNLLKFVGRYETSSRKKVNK